MARLDRLAPVKVVAQLGVTIGRQFSYELFRAVSPLNEPTLQQGLRQLVEAELLYQRGIPPEATYTFKHALIQDTAYQSLLRSTRQQFHQRIAQVLAEQFPETAETQSELLAHHYTAAGLSEHAIGYWQQVGQRAVERSATVEAISYLNTTLELLKTLPDTPERIRQELTLQTILGPVLIATKGYGAPEAEATITLCTEQGFAQWLARGMILQGWALAEQGQESEGIAQMQQGLAAWQATGAEITRPHTLAMLAEACGKAGLTEEGLIMLAEGLAAVCNNGEHRWEPELYRLKGELVLIQASKKLRTLIPR